MFYISLLLNPFKHYDNRGLILSDTTYLKTTDDRFDYDTLNSSMKNYTLNQKFIEDPSFSYINKIRVFDKKNTETYLLIPNKLNIISIYIEDTEIYSTKDIFNYYKLPYDVYNIPENSIGKDIYIMTSIPMLENFKGNYSMYYGNLTDIITSFLRDSFFNIFVALTFIVISIVMLFINFISKIKNSLFIILASLITFIVGIVFMLSAPVLVLAFYRYSNEIYLLIYIIFKIAVLIAIYYSVLVFKNFENNFLRILTVVYFVISIVINVYLVTTIILGTAPLISHQGYILITLILNIFLTIFYYVINKFKNNLIDIIIIIFMNLFLLMHGLNYDTYYQINRVVFMILFISFICCVTLKTFLIVHQRKLDVIKLNNNLFEERKICDYLHTSHINNFSIGKVNNLAKSIVLDVNNLFEDIEEFFIAQINKVGQFEILYQNKEGEFYEEYERTFIENYDEVITNSFSKNYSDNILYATFKASTYEILFIYFRKTSNFDVKDKTAINILFPSISESLNNTEIFSQYMDTQEELFLEVSKVLNKKSGDKNSPNALMRYAYLIGKANGLNDDDAFNFKLAAAIYDIGKFAIPDSLSDFSKINSSQFDYYVEHIILGQEILSNSNGKIFQIASYCSLDHHENYDGTGFLNKKEDGISIYGRMIRVINLLDRFVKRSKHFSDFSIENCITYLLTLSGKEADPKQIDLLISAKKEIWKIIEEEYELES